MLKNINSYSFQFLIEINNKNYKKKLTDLIII